jgi:hypothetical protein
MENYHLKHKDIESLNDAMKDPEFPDSGHSSADADICTALLGCAECTPCGKSTGQCPMVFLAVSRLRLDPPKGDWWKID